MKKNVGYADEKPARVCMLTPGGQRWFEKYEDATDAIRKEHPTATRVKRWQENCLQYEDYMDRNGNVLTQLEFADPPVLAAGFTYGQTVCPVCNGLGDDNVTYEFKKCDHCNGTGKV